MTRSTNRKIKVLQVIMVLKYGGSERLASFLAYSIDRSRFEMSVLGLYGGGALSKELERNDVPHYFFGHKNRFEERYGLHRKIYKFLRQHNPDIIQVHGSYPFTRILPAATITNTKLIYTLHSKHTLQTVPRLRFMVKLCSILCNKIVVVSNDLKRFIEKEIWIGGRRIVVIHNGVDLEKFDPKEGNRQDPASLIRTPGVTLVGVIGRLTDAKDHAGLFKAWANVCRQQPTTKLVLVGDGELREQLEQLARNLNILNEVVFLGDRDDIPQVISRMDLMVLPSKREGFPISLLESMAMKKPVIATTVGGVPEIITHDFNGYLVPAQDPKALADAIFNFFKHRKAFSRMADEGYITVKEKFASRVVIKKYEDLYDEVYHA